MTPDERLWLLIITAMHALAYLYTFVLRGGETS